MIAAQPIAAVDDATAAERYRRLMVLATPGTGRGPLSGRILDNVLRWAAEASGEAQGVPDDARWQAMPETRPLAQCGLPPKLVNMLERDGMTTLGDVAAATSTSLWQRPGMGPSAMDALADALRRFGLRFSRG